MDTIVDSLQGLAPFAGYFAASLIMFGLSVAIYVRVTPYREIDLIRQGNMAASLSLSGALLGMALPLAAAISQSETLSELVLWGVISLAVQLLVYLVVRLMVPRISDGIRQGVVAQGLFLGSIATCVGLLNAACMTY
jgi:putative membrane protein